MNAEGDTRDADGEINKLFCLTLVGFLWPWPTWGANPVELYLPATDGRGNSTEYLRAGPNIFGRRTGRMMIWGTLRNSYTTSGLCGHFFKRHCHIAGRRCHAKSCNVDAKTLRHAASGILTIAFMMRLSGIALGTLLLMLVPRWKKSHCACRPPAFPPFPLDELRLLFSGWLDCSCHLFADSYYTSRFHIVSSRFHRTSRVVA